jgi:DNA gyrase subunit A
VENIQDISIQKALDDNYMPYAMSVIVDRALPKIDGFKPAHRKLLYTMYKMGLLTKPKTKSANIVGQTMALNPHGDGAIYGTLVRLTENHEAMLVPLISSKGNFGKYYSRDMAYAAARYTEAGLLPVASTLFDGIEEDAVDLVPNYDGTMLEPELLPVKFPLILVDNSMGIAVSMASSFGGYNLVETCQAVIDFLKTGKHTPLIPDFSTKGFIINDEAAIEEIDKTGRGSITLRGKASVTSDARSIEITELPYSCSIEQLLESVISLVKSGKLKDITDIRDMTDISGMKILVELSKGVDASKVLNQLYRLTPLQSSVSMNFNLLIGGKPKVLGVSEILGEWVKFRRECITRKCNFKLRKLTETLSLQEGFHIIVSDKERTDRTIDVIRNSTSDKESVKTLCQEFNLTKAQAEYVIEIKLKSLANFSVTNLKKKLAELTKERDSLTKLISSTESLNAFIIREQEEIIKTFGAPRKTLLLDPSVLTEVEKFEEYPVAIQITSQGYLKKIRTDVGKVSGKSKLKDGDEILKTMSCMNSDKLLVFTEDNCVYRLNLWSIPDSLLNQYGQFIPNLIDSESKVIHVSFIADNRQILVVYKSGYGQRISTMTYQTGKKQVIKLTSALKDTEGDIMFLDTIEPTDYNSHLQLTTFKNNLSLTSIVKFDLIPTTTRASRTRICRVPDGCELTEVARIQNFNFIYTKCLAAKCPGKMTHVMKGGSK